MSITLAEKTALAIYKRRIPNRPPLPHLHTTGGVFAADPGDDKTRRRAYTEELFFGFYL